MAEDIYVASESAMLQHDGESVVVHKGVHTVRRGHPLLDEYPDLFEPIKVTFDVDDGGESSETSESSDADKADEPDEVEEELPDGVEHLGSGWYDVDGEKVRGRDAAIEAARETSDDR